MPCGKGFALHCVGVVKRIFCARFGGFVFGFYLFS